jgi:WD40 repeat protein
LKILRLLFGLLMLVGLAACADAPPAPAASAAPATPLPAATPEPWQAPAAAIALDNVEQLTLLGSAQASTGSIYYMDVSRNGQYVLTVSGDQVVQVWDVAEGASVWRKVNSDAVRGFFAANDTQIVLVTRTQHIEVYDLTDQSPVQSFLGHEDVVGPAALAPDGGLLALGTSDGTVVVWDVASEQRAAEFGGFASPVRQVAFSPNGDLLAAASSDRVVRLWEMATGETRAVLADFDGSPEVIAFSRDSSQIAVSVPFGTRVWSTVDGALLHDFPTEAGTADRALVFTPEGYLLGAGATDTVTMWNLETGEIFARLPGHGGAFHAMALSPAGTLLVTVARPGHTYLWDVSNPNQRVTLSAIEDQVSLAGWTSDSQALVLAAADGTVSFWGVPAVAAATE